MPQPSIVEQITAFVENGSPQQAEQLGRSIGRLLQHITNGDLDPAVTDDILLALETAGERARRTTGQSPTETLRSEDAEAFAAGCLTALASVGHGTLDVSSEPLLLAFADNPGRLAHPEPGFTTGDYQACVNWLIENGDVTLGADGDTVALTPAGTARMLELVAAQFNPES